jgi:outer membrane lipoprotein-sorting protein
MNRTLPGLLIALVVAAGANAAAPPNLTAEQVIDRYVAACGGADKWRAIQTMGWNGHIETGPGGISKMPFMMLFRRPDATRFEMMKEGQRSVRIFDGKEGWRLRPTGTGLPEIKDYSADEISYAHDAAGPDGPLFDHKTKGVTVTLKGMDEMAGHRAYHLELTLPSGRKRTDWIDAESFLDLRYDREIHNSQGRTGMVSVYLRDYRTVEGLTMPFVIETGGGAGGDPDKMIIEKIAINPPLEERLFAKPSVPSGRHQGVVVDTTKAH